MNRSYSLDGQKTCRFLAQPWRVPVGEQAERSERRPRFSDLPERLFTPANQSSLPTALSSARALARRFVFPPLSCNVRKLDRTSCSRFVGAERRVRGRLDLEGGAGKMTARENKLGDIHGHWWSLQAPKLSLGKARQVFPQKT